MPPLCNNPATPRVMQTPFMLPLGKREMLGIHRCLHTAGISRMQLPLRKHLSLLTLLGHTLSLLMQGVSQFASSLPTSISSLEADGTRRAYMTYLGDWRGRERTLERLLVG